MLFFLSSSSASVFVFNGNVVEELARFGIARVVLRPLLLEFFEGLLEDSEEDDELEPFFFFILFVLVFLFFFCFLCFIVLISCSFSLDFSFATPAPKLEKLWTNDVKALTSFFAIVSFCDAPDEQEPEDVNDDSLELES